MIKAILFDADGVIINKPKLFSQYLMEEYNVPPDSILSFFENEFQLSVVNQADLKVIIEPYIKKWNWPKSVDELLEYWFKKEHYVDQRIVDLVTALKSRNILCVATSNQEKYRSSYIKNEMEFNKFLDAVYTSSDLGVKKPQPEFWQAIYDKIQPMAKSEILVLDDKTANIESARDFGFHAEFYENFDNFEKILDRYLIQD